MANNSSLGFVLIGAGAIVFISALNRTTPSMLAGLLYGSGALGDPTPKGEHASPSVSVNVGQGSVTGPIIQAPHSNGEGGIITPTPGGTALIDPATMQPYSPDRVG